MLVLEAFLLVMAIALNTVDAAVDPGGGGWQGHVMFVEQVNSDGSIVVSQYNAGENGTYSVATIDASQVSNLVFVHFPGM